MIVTGTYPKPEHPVIVDLRVALGEAIDRQQAAIVRAYLDQPIPLDLARRDWFTTPCASERHTECRAPKACSCSCHKADA